MFSGIIETITIVADIQSQTDLTRLSLTAPDWASEVSVGDSIAVNGACLTVTSVDMNRLTFEMMRETLQATSLGTLQIKDRVNLERALKVSDRLDGHLVTGHVDAVVMINDITRQGHFVKYVLECPEHLRPYIAPKGSVCLDGVSLTVGEVDKDTFSVYLIPHTLSVTTLGFKQPRDSVNIELDVVARYIGHYLKSTQQAA